MKKLYISFCLFISTLPLCAQNGELKSEFDYSNFPEVSFIWHEYNPTTVEESQFFLKENDVEIPFTVSVCEQDTDVIENASRSIVFLWEDMGCNNSMFRVVKDILSDYADLIPDESANEYLLATFNRQMQGQDVLNIRTDGFVTTPEEFGDAVHYVSHSTRTYREESNKSDVFKALNEALAILHQRDNEVKAIVLFTAGRPLESSATTSVVMVQQSALKYHIPIYVIQYARAYGESVKLESLADETFGWNFTLDDAYDEVNANNGMVYLRLWDILLNYQSWGKDYQITFVSNAPRNQQASTLSLDVNGNLYAIPMPAVGYSFGSWIMFHIWQSCLIVFGLLSIIALIVVLSVVKSKKTAREMNRLRMEQQKASEQAQQQANQIAQMEEQAQKAQQKALQEKAKQEEANLLNLMHAKNAYPHLQYADADGNGVVYEVCKPVIVIGRDQDADLQIPNKTVSRKHARIKFNGLDFTIEDLNSTNGTIVGGVPVRTTPHVLRDHDLINIGSVLITYYL